MELAVTASASIYHYDNTSSAATTALITCVDWSKFKTIDYDEERKKRDVENKLRISIKRKCMFSKKGKRC